MYRYFDWWWLFRQGIFAETEALPEKFSCLEMKQQIQAEIYEITKELLAYFNKESKIYTTATSSEFAVAEPEIEYHS